MGSYVKNVFTQAFSETMDEIDKKMDKAFQNAMKRMEKELYEVMEEASVKNFYRGYSPYVYLRTNQLDKAISLRVEDVSSGNIFSFDVLPKYDEEYMDHSEYNIIATYRHKKNKKSTGKISRYICHVKLKNKPDEEEIMERSLGEGLHWLGGTIFDPVGTDAPIWLKDDDENSVLLDALEDYVNNNAIRIFNEEYDKLS